MASTILRPLNKSKYPEQRIKYDYKKFFPNLGDEYEVLAPNTGDYNCIAHTLGKNNVWVNPITGTKSVPFAEMDKIYTTIGYKRLSLMDFSYKLGIPKIVVYAIKNPDGSIKEITHGAIQDNCGTWESKLGPWPLIRHLTPDALNSSLYGKPVAVYEKLFSQ
jgi:type VI secretion system secreted protein VgrG